MRTKSETSHQRHYETDIKTTNCQETRERLAQYIGGKTQVYGMIQSGRQEWLRPGEGNETIKIEETQRRKGTGCYTKCFNTTYS